MVVVFKEALKCLGMVLGFFPDINRLPLNARSEATSFILKEDTVKFISLYCDVKSKKKYLIIYVLSQLVLKCCAKTASCLCLKIQICFNKHSLHSYQIKMSKTLLQEI